MPTRKNNEQQYEARFRRLFETAKDGILILEASTGEITEVNPYLRELLGYSETELIGKKLWDLGLIEDHERSLVAYRALQKTGYVRYDNLPLKTKSGQLREVEFVSNVYEVTGERVIQCNIRDITDRKNAERSLAKINESLRLSIKELADRNAEIGLLSELGDSLNTCVSIEEAHRVVARFSVQLFPGTHGVLYTMKETRGIVEAAVEWGGATAGEEEFSPNDCVGLRRGRVHAVNGEDLTSGLTCQHLAQPASNYLCAPMIAYGEIQGVLHLGAIEPKKGSMENPLNPFEKSKLGLAGTVADYIGLALANLKLRSALREQSIHDLVTGLYNRRYMKEALSREIRRALREQRPLGILMFDIDHFKNMNDTYGHEAGDAVLTALGAFFKAQTRGSDIPCRYGGEEFLLILPRITPQECEEWAEKMRKGIKLLNIQIGGQALPHISVSVGLAAYPGHGDISDGFLKIADTALYKAKELGRDRIVVGYLPAVIPSTEDAAINLN